MQLITFSQKWLVIVIDYILKVIIQSTYLWTNEGSGKAAEVEDWLKGVILCLILVFFFSSSCSANRKIAQFSTCQLPKPSSKVSVKFVAFFRSKSDRVKSWESWTYRPIALYYYTLTYQINVVPRLFSFSKKSPKIKLFQC